jgi:ribosomal protein S18 acetylase RimI-like enzyme
LESVDFRELDAFPEPEFESLSREAFSDFGQPSPSLADVLRAEAAARVDAPPVDAKSLRIGAFLGARLVGWTFSQAEPGHCLHMVNSGVARDERGKRVYSRLVQLTIAHANARGYTSIRSRHVPTNNAVIIPKLRLGFQVSGFEYSEVYGPLVRLTYLVAPARRELFRSRAQPIVAPRGQD